MKKYIKDSSVENRSIVWELWSVMKALSAHDEDLAIMIIVGVAACASTLTATVIV
jgi:hypothetical protein